MSTVQPVLVPQVNVNDDEVRLIRWEVSDGATLAIGDLLCIVETSKAATEITAEAAGVFKPTAPLDEMIAVGAPLGYIGPSLPEIEAWLAERAQAARTATLAGGVKATPRAAALAEQHHVGLADIAAAGVTGTIKESDVERFVAARRGARADAAPAAPAASAAVPAALRPNLSDPVALTRHERSVIDGLQSMQRSLILTTLDFDVDLGAYAAGLAALQRGGAMVSFQHLVIAALGRALPEFPRLMSFRDAAEVYTYRQADIAFVLRSPDGRLFTPVVRNVSALTPTDVARQCGALAMRVNRGRIAPEDLDAACFTVSHIAEPGVSRFTALPNRFQSAILAIAAMRGSVVTCTLSYDHGLCDGTYAALFMRATVSAMDALL